MDEKPKKKKTSRFKTVNDNKKQAIFDKRKKPNTNKATKLWLNCFCDYLLEKDYNTLEELPTNELPLVLEQFYSEVRKKESKNSPPVPENSAENDDDDPERLYKNTTLKAIRGALARHFKETRSIDIISSEKFIRANQIFEGVQKINKEFGTGNIVSKPPIDDADLAKITEYFERGMNGPTNPALLQELCLFYVVLYMCRRGRENLRNMKKNTFALATDPEDHREYIFQQIDEADKNHSHNDTDKSNDGRIYEVPGSAICPVEVFKLYTAKLNPNNDNLWQRPKQVIHDVLGPWYDNIPIGKNTLDNFMKTISKKANLHLIYTNHSIRSTSITVWDENNIAAQHICEVSGHKSEETIRSYSTKCPANKKREMCDILSDRLANAPKKAKFSNTLAVAQKVFPAINVQDTDFQDWVPIENNKDDFDLGQVLEEIEKQNENIQVHLGQISHSAHSSSLPPNIPLENDQYLVYIVEVEQSLNITAKSGRISSEDEIDILLHGTDKQKQHLLKARSTRARKESSSEDEFEKQMSSELKTTIELVEAAHNRGFTNKSSDKVSASTDKPGSSTVSDDKSNSKQYYDNIYFDSDSDEEGTREEKKTKKREVMSNDDLLYDPDMDDEDQKWIDNQRCLASGIPLSKKAKLKNRKLPTSDAVLDCPACMITLSRDCQRHEIYKNQYRAMFVTNCKVLSDEILRFPKGGKFKQKKKTTGESAGSTNSNQSTGGNNSAATTSNSSDDDVYHPVKCEQCNTEVGVFDKDEVYHFFNVLASHS